VASVFLPQLAELFTLFLVRYRGVELFGRTPLRRGLLPVVNDLNARRRGLLLLAAPPCHGSVIPVPPTQHRRKRQGFGILRGPLAVRSVRGNRHAADALQVARKHSAKPEPAVKPLGATAGEPPGGLAVSEKIPHAPACEVSPYSPLQLHPLSAAGPVCGSIALLGKDVVDMTISRLKAQQR
jgi:hypothetical protein